jgi:release factor H-coupled RctB family protein
MKTNNPLIHQSISPSAPSVRLFASAKNWIEGEALRQLYAAAKLEGMRLAVGFPDLHPGKGGPVGAAFVTEGVIYPYLIGGDIGCGMALFKTDLVQRDVKLNRWAELRFGLEHPWEGEVREVLAASDLESTEFDEALGTIGGGNHFAELQRVEEVLDATAFKEFGLGRQHLVVLVHSGSRGLGESILRTYVDERQASGSDADSFAAAAYLRDHDQAVRWAKANRALIARRFAEALGAEAELLWDGCHNSIQSRSGVPPAPGAVRSASYGGQAGRLSYVHRKGAVASEGGPVMIPGSRGSLSYLVKPTGDGASHAWSLAHGAGRKWARSETRLRMRERFGLHQLTQTPLGGRVICERRELLYEEAPAAYKNIEDVVQDLVDAELVSVIATFRPLLTYKTRARNRTG